MEAALRQRGLDVRETGGALSAAARRAGPAYDRGVVCVLAVSDEVDEGLYADLGPVRAAELVVACGDLPFEYLGYLMNGARRAAGVRARQP